jgi:hypothetical protein
MRAHVLHMPEAKQITAATFTLLPVCENNRHCKLGVQQLLVWPHVLDLGCANQRRA